MIKQLIIVASLIFPISVFAEPTKKVSVYDVEIIVFQNIQSALEGNEIWVKERVDMELKDIDKAIDINQLPQQNSDLTKAFEMLESDSHYRVLTHKQWFQNAEPQSNSKVVRLSTADGELVGTIKFFKSRFLHVDLNLIFQQTESKSIFQGGNATDSPMVAFQLRERRRVRSNEIQYFDHPKFGALIQVKKIKESKS